MGAPGPFAACGLNPIADNTPETRLTTKLPGLVGTLTAAGTDGVTTAAVLAWEVAVATAGVAATVTVRGALVVGTLAAAAGFGRDTAGAVVLATLAEIFEVTALCVGDPAAEDTSCAVAVDTFESVLPAGEVDVFTLADGDAAVCAGVDAVNGGSAAGFVMSGVLSGAVAGIVVPEPVTEVLAPPEACATPEVGSVDDPG